MRPGRFQRELSLLRTRLGEVIATDPYFSPLPALDPVPYSAPAWQPRSFARFAGPPVPLDIPFGI